MMIKKTLIIIFVILLAGCQPPSRDLTKDEIMKIDNSGGGDLPYLGLLNGNVYNGNPDVTVNSIRITLLTWVQGEPNFKYYFVNNLNIKPYTTHSFEIDVLPVEDGIRYGWRVTNGTGY